MCKLKIPLVLILLSFYQFSNAQDYSLHAIDSLKIVLNKTTLLEDKGNLLIKIAELYLENQLDSAKVYRSKAEKITASNNFNLALLKIKESIVFENYEQAKKRIDTAKVSLKINTNDRVLRINFIEASHLSKVKENHASIALIDATLKEYAYLKNNTIADFYILQASNYLHIISLGEMLPNINAAVSIYKKTNNQIGLNNCYQMLCFQHLFLGDFDLAVEYAVKSTLNANYLKSKSFKIREIIVLGTGYYYKKEFSLAVQQFKKALDLNKNLNVTRFNNVANQYLNLANIEAGNFKTVIKDCKKQLLSAASISSRYELYHQIVWAYNELNDFEQANVYLKKMEVIISTEKIAERQVLRFLEVAKETSRGLGIYDKAYAYSEEHLSKFRAFNDSINAQNLIENQVKFQTKEKDIKFKNLELKNREEKLSTAKANERLHILLLIFGFSLISILVGFNYYNSLKSKKEEIEQLFTKQTKLTVKLAKSNQIIQRTFGIISHDLRNPFNALLGFSNLLVTDFNTLSEDQKLNYATTIRKLSEDNFNLTQNLLQWTLKQHQGYVVNKQQNYLQELVKCSIDSLAGFIESKKGQVQNNIKPIKVFVDREIILTILNNLLTNAIKFSDLNTSIIINSQSDENGFSIIIYNEGDIVSKEIAVQINNYLADTVADNTTHNLGLGLTIAKEMAALHNATIMFDTKDGCTNVILRVSNKVK